MNALEMKFKLLISKQNHGILAVFFVTLYLNWFVSTKKNSEKNVNFITWSSTIPYLNQFDTSVYCKIVVYIFLFLSRCIYIDDLSQAIGFFFFILALHFVTMCVLGGSFLFAAHGKMDLWFIWLHVHFIWFSFVFFAFYWYWWK